MITGKELIALGYKPGKWFGEAIEHANRHQLSGEALITYLEEVRPRTIDPHAAALPYHQNIAADTPDEQTNLQSVLTTMNLVMRTPTVVDGAIMPDACPTGSPGHIPVGGVVVAHSAIHPNMHSADICCSVMATAFGMTDPRRVLDAAHSVTHFGGGGREEFSTLPEELTEQMAANPYLNSEAARQLATQRMGTQGDGNHFLFVGQSRNSGQTYMVTHHGSRGLGAELFKQGMRVAERFRQQLSPRTLPQNAWIPFDTPEGQHYWEALQLVRQWTKLNHEVLHYATSLQINAPITDRLWNEHNFVFRIDDLFYHAKGATPLDGRFLPDAVDNRRLVPLNMAQPILIIQGETTATNLGFAPHGAGRNVSRRQHKRMHNHKTNEQLFAEETAGLDIRFYSGHIDVSELPSAYKDADSIIQQMHTYGLGEVVDEIIPYGSIMAGDWSADAPWRRKQRKK